MQTTAHARFPQGAAAPHPARSAALLRRPQGRWLWAALLSCLAVQAAPVAAQTAAPQAAAASAAAPAAAPMRLRGTIETVALPRITFKERNGQLMTLTLPENAVVTEVLAIEMAAIKPGAFIGTATTPGSDGRLRALEVLVFPESARGTGEGHYPWDLAPQSMMTNATVADLSAAPQGRELTLRYKDGEKKVFVPDGVPVVTFKPGDRALLVPGARAVITAVLREDGATTATRLLVGRDGFVPPM